LLGPPPGFTGPVQPLWSGGASRNGARFTPRETFGSIYVASDPVTALKEVVAIFLTPHAPPLTLRTPPWTVFAVDGILTELVDLTDAAVQRTLGTNLQELTGDWVVSQDQYLKGDGPLPPTQLLGQVGYESGVMLGFKYPSSKSVADGYGIVVFSDLLVSCSPSHLEVSDPDGDLEQRLP